jgi:heme A synthase
MTLCIIYLIIGQRPTKSPQHCGAFDKNRGCPGQTPSVQWVALHENYPWKYHRGNVIVISFISICFIYCTSTLRQKRMSWQKLKRHNFVVLMKWNKVYCIHVGLQSMIGFQSVMVTSNLYCLRKTSMMRQ